MHLLLSHVSVVNGMLKPMLQCLFTYYCLLNCSLIYIFIDGGWDQVWSSWGPCSSTFGPGTRERRDSCVGKKFYGKDCDPAEQMSETEKCYGIIDQGVLVLILMGGVKLTRLNRILTEPNQHSIVTYII